jgi:hypothetical protein
MKRELLSNGWNEVTTKRIRVIFKAKAFQPVSFWLDFHKRHPNMDTDGRNHCQRCGKRWKDSNTEMMTYFVMTDKGNKVVCEPCWNQLEQSTKEDNGL